MPLVKHLPDVLSALQSLLHAWAGAAQQDDHSASAHASR
jgi:hypothetical protein